jgi:D-alanyl-D-alanine carboxypeptidase/D-alanyl-D-alanine-endopeptidase (penicillin-binding protein 4)
MLVMIALAAVVFVLLCVGAVFVGKAAGSSHRTADGPTAPTSTAPTRAVPANQLAAASIPTCSISGPASAAPLKQLYGSVIDIASGKSLFARNDSVGEPPASGMKVLTAAAAISVLGPDYQITTQVVDAPQAGTIVLVGQGDATLSALAAGQSVYTGAPTLASLAAATMTGYNKVHDGVPITRVVLDSSYWDPNDNWDPTWPRTEQTGGFQSEVTALQVDGDRANPRLQTSPRGSNPIMTAGKAFVAALGLDPSTDIELGHAETGAPVLGSVQSQPVKTLVSQMLQNSDNTLGEMLARIVSVKENLGGSSSSLQTAISTALGKFGVDTGGVTIKDGSGESNQDSVPAAFMSKFMGAVSQKENGLQYVAAGMPVAGKSGSLATRFQGANAIAKGQVVAKPGFIATAYSLSGYMTAKDGSALAFAFYGVGAGIGSTANGALDTLATAVFSCGKNLSNN